MKKILIVILVTMLIVFVLGCTTQQKEDNTTTVKEEVPMVNNDGVLRVGMDLQYPPFETFDTDNNAYGVSVDVAQGLADYLGLELEVVNMDFSTLIPALETKDIDIAIASMSITEERELKVDFSNPYFYFKIIALLNSEYAEANGVNDETTTDDIWALTDTKFIGLAGQISTSIPETHGFTVEQAIDKASAITEVTQGRSDVLIMSPEVIVGANKAFPTSTQVFWGALDISPIGMAVTEGNAKLLEKANDYIKTLNDEGGVYDSIRGKYQADLDELYGGGVTMDIYIYE